MFLLLLFSAHAHSKTFQEVHQADQTGLELEPEEARTRYLEEARAYARYRRSPTSSFARDFSMACVQDSEPGSLCRYLTPPKSEPKLATPAPLRHRFFVTLLRLDAVSERKKVCPVVKKSLHLILEAPEAATLHTRVLYWLWICAEATAKPQQAREYKELLWTRYPLDHHSFLALKGDPRMDQLITSKTELEVSFRSSAETALNPVIASIESLHQLREDGAAAEVARLESERFQTLEPEVQLYLASLLARVSAAIPSALPITRLLIPLLRERRSLLNGETLRLLFPTDYLLFDSQRGKAVKAGELIESYRDSLTSEVVLALAHYESAFNPKAASIAGALGLMQILPATANQYLLSAGAQSTVTREQLLDPGFSLRLGVTILLDLKKQFNGSLPLALAAYNAGATAVREWLARTPKIKDPQLQADLLLMNSERELHMSNYVSSVLGKADWYSRLNIN